MFATTIGLASAIFAFLVFLHESNRRRFGEIKSQLSDLTAEVKSQGTRIDETNARIDALGASLIETNARID